MKLSECEPLKKVTISGVNCSKKVKERLAILGVFENTVVTLIRRAPFGGPIEIKARDFYLAIRKNQADEITVEYYV